MAAETLRDYLLSLGFKVDEAGYKKFVGGMESAAKSVVKLVAAVEAAALSVGAGVAAFASNLEGLYFASQRTGASVENLKAFEKAAQNMGAGAGEALQSVESLARFLRENPGGEGLLQSLGIQTRDLNGKMRDEVDVMVDLGGQLSKMPYYLAAQYAKMFGVSEKTLMAMRDPRFGAELREQKKRLEDSGYTKAAKDAHDFMVKLRELGTYMEMFGLKVYDALVKRLGGGVEKLSEWMEKNGQMVADRVADILLMLLNLAEMIGPAIRWLVDKLIELDKKTDGWSTRIIALVAAANLLGGAALIGGILSLASAFVKLGAGIVGAANAASGGILGRLLSLIGKGGVGAALLFHSEELNAGEQDELARRRALGDADFAKRGLPTDKNATAASNDNSAPTKPTDKTAPRGIRNNNPGNLNYVGQQGATKEEGAGGRFAVFGSADEGLSALAKQLRLYGQRGVKTIEGIISKFAPPSENNTKAYISNVSKSLGVGANQELDLTNPETLSKLMDAIIRIENGRNPYTKTQVSAAAGKSVQVAQTTNINVSGGDAASTARAVAGEQNRVNEGLSRNLASVVS